MDDFPEVAQLKQAHQGLGVSHSLSLVLFQKETGLITYKMSINHLVSSQIT